MTTDEHFGRLALAASDFGIPEALLAPETSDATRSAPWGHGKTEAEINAEVDRRLAEWEAAMAADHLKHPRPSLDERLALGRAREAELEEIWRPAALDGAADPWDLPLDPHVDPMVELRAREHTLAVDKEAERLRVAADARLLVAVERGGFGLFDPSAVIDVRDLGKLGTPAPLIEGVLQRETLSMLFAEPYAGKSFLALDWACRVATGRDWLGRTVQLGKVLILAAEGLATYLPRLSAWEVHNGVVVDRHRLVIYPRTVNLLDPSSVELLAAYQAAEQFDLIVVDTLSRAISGADENSAEVMSALIAAASRLREAHEPSNVMLVHHTKKDDPEQYRGSSVLGAGLDTIVCMKRVAPSEPADPRRRLLFQKDKSGEAGAPIDLTFEQVTPSAVLVLDRAAGSSPIARLLLTMPTPTTKDELARAAAVAGLYGSAKSARSRIDKLVSAGELLVDGENLTVARPEIRESAR